MIDDFLLAVLLLAGYATGGIGSLFLVVWAVFSWKQRRG